VTGADPCARDSHGGPALIWAAAGGKLEIISLLLDYGADRAALDGEGASAADIAEQRAERNGGAEILELLKRPVQDKP